MLRRKVVSRHFVPRDKLIGADLEPAEQLQLSLYTLDWGSRREETKPWKSFVLRVAGTSCLPPPKPFLFPQFPFTALLPHSKLDLRSSSPSPSTASEVYFLLLFSFIVFRFFQVERSASNSLSFRA